MARQCVFYMTNATPGNIPVTAAAVAAGLRAAAASAGLVNEDGGELLITERTVRSGSCRGTKRADHFQRRFGC